ncbi:MAG: hypothetical protein A2293_07555 [Elusimicrobia bacterium RIFOXYB2_FULL_49_7]|nr:MAG: hypothetical protein A2293_07555 [Elusimicrobia bacterium RIFOXYB2_FULL_49_7]
MKYISLFNTLKAEISNGTFPSGTHIPHTAELLKQYHVSLTTVVKAVKLLEKQGLVKRIKSKGTFVLDEGQRNLMGYQKKERIGLIFKGFLSSEMNTHFFVKAYQGLENICREQGKRLIPLGTEERDMAALLQEIENAGISGVVIYALYDGSLFAGLKRMGIPVVCCDFIDHTLPIDQVTTDHIRGGTLAIHQLHELGHRKVLFFGNYQHKKRQNDRDHDYWNLAAANEARRQGIKQYSDHFISFGGGEEMMKKEMRRIIESHADHTGFICASASFALLLKTILESNGLSDKLSRDTILFSDLDEPITIFDRKVIQCRWDTRDMGRVSGEVLLNILKGGPHHPGMHYIPMEIRS